MMRITTPSPQQTTSNPTTATHKHQLINHQQNSEQEN
jgi:hypothetical protein